MDVTQALKDAENSLRDFIAVVLEKQYGSNWLDRCGVPNDRIERWKERKEVEKKRQDTGAVEERLLYYADFYDLKTILKKNWSGEFSETFGDWKTMEVWLSELEKLRDPDAHRRELLPHQKNLILGISGEIRTKMVRRRSRQETSEDYYPRIESVRDNLGTIFIPTHSFYGFIYPTNLTLRVGDLINVVVTATDPMEMELEYRIKTIHGSYDSGWTKSNSLSITLTEKDIRKLCDLNIYIRSQRAHHAYGDNDSCVTFRYDVLPPKM